MAWPVTGIREIRRYLAVVGPLAFELCVLGVGGGVTSRMARGRRCHPYRRTAFVQASSTHSLESCFDGHTGEELGQSPPTPHTWC